MQYPSTLLKQNTSAICSNKNHLDRKQCNLREREKERKGYLQRVQKQDLHIATTARLRKEV
jgi:hypothetical protein